MTQNVADPSLGQVELPESGSVTFTRSGQRYALERRTGSWTLYRVSHHSSVPVCSLRHLDDAWHASRANREGELEAATWRDLIRRATA